jgi:DNA relaxase NicK
MQTDRHLDYLSVTFPIHVDENILEQYFGKFQSVGRGHHNYAVKKESDIGAILQTQGEANEGVHLTLSGEPLASVRAALGDERPLLDMLGHENAKASRVDLAIDVFGSTLTPDQLWDMYVKGMVVTKARKDRRETAKLGTSNGFYIGSEKSDKFMRVYDKAAERAVDGEAWLRLELQCRRLVARAYLDTLIAHDDLNAVYNRSITSFCAWPTDEIFNTVTSDDLANFPPLPKKRAAFWRWMHNQVIPAMVQHDLKFPEEETMQTIGIIFYKKLQEAKGGQSKQPSIWQQQRRSHKNLGNGD